MRTIKFRVFDTEKNRFLEGGELIYKLYPGEEGFEVHTNELQYAHDNGKYEQSRFIITEFTGLLDKNGKEIYEGDIVTSLYKFEGCNGLYQVVWRNNSSSYFPLKHGEHQQSRVSISMNDLERCEIIGNIYETPNLLSNQ